MVNTQHIVWCQHGCGNNFHSKCFKAWADNCRSDVTCPLCRGVWTPQDLAQLSKPTKFTLDTNIHIGVRCGGCSTAPIKGNRYKCTTCTDYNLCEECFANRNIHGTHSFITRSKPARRHQDDDEWTPANRTVLMIESRYNARTLEPEEPVPTQTVPISSTRNNPSTQTRTTTTVQPTTDLSHLMYRDISPEDYETLLQLDEGDDTAKGVPQSAIDSLESITVEEGTTFTDCCPICLEEMIVGEQVKKLPNCTHIFHKLCIDMWLVRSNNCAVCNNIVFTNIDEIREQERAIVESPVSNITQEEETSSVGSLTLTQRQPTRPPRVRRRVPSTTARTNTVTTTQPTLGQTSSSHFHMTTNEERERNLQTIRRKLQVKRASTIRGAQSATIPSGIELSGIGVGIGGSEQSTSAPLSNTQARKLRPKSPSVTERRKKEPSPTPQFDLSGMQVYNGERFNEESVTTTTLRPRSASSGRLVKGTARKENKSQSQPVDHVGLDLVGADLGIETRSNTQVPKGKQIKGTAVTRKPLQDENMQNFNFALSGNIIGPPSGVEKIETSIKPPLPTKLRTTPVDESDHKNLTLGGIDPLRAESGKFRKGKQIKGSMINKQAIFPEPDTILGLTLANSTLGKNDLAAPKGRQVKGSVTRKAKENTVMQLNPSLELMGTTFDANKT